MGSGETAGGGEWGAECSPEVFHWEIFADLLGKREASEKWKMEKKRRKIVRWEV